jgi:hypothetical protein
VISGCSGATPGAVGSSADGASCGSAYQNCYQGNCALFNYTLTCGKSISGNQICQKDGFTGAIDSHGYYHYQCAGPLPISCSTTQSTCIISNTCDCTGCGGNQSGGANYSESGDGGKVYSQGLCPGWNRGWLIRVKCY